MVPARIDFDHEARQVGNRDGRWKVGWYLQFVMRRPDERPWEIDEGRVSRVRPGRLKPPVGHRGVPARIRTELYHGNGGRPPVFAVVAFVRPLGTSTRRISW